MQYRVKSTPGETLLFYQVQEHIDLEDKQMRSMAESVAMPMLIWKGSEPSNGHDRHKKGGQGACHFRTSAWRVNVFEVRNRRKGRAALICLGLYLRLCT